MIPIIIPVYGKLDYLSRCLSAIWENSGSEEFQIILVDDRGPETVTADWIRSVPGYDDDRKREKTPPIIISHMRNLGYTRAINTGIKHALQRLSGWLFLVLLNTDTEPQPGWLAALRETAEKAHRVGIIGAKLLHTENPDQIIHGGTMDLLGTHKGGQESKGHCNKRTDEVWVTGACMAITRECLIDCGLLDSNYLHFCSDSDYCLTARSRGYRVIYQPLCRVFHGHSITVREVVDQRKIAMDQQRLLDKWGGAMLREWLLELPMHLYRGQMPPFGER